MFKKKEERIRSLADYIIKNKATVRDTAKEFGIPKSSVHRYVTNELFWVDQKLYNEVRKVMDFNTSQRAVRGGITTKNKFENKK